MKPNEFQCDCCHGIFVKGWSDDEAQSEAKENGFDIQTCNVVCDDCFHEIMGWVEKTYPPQSEKC